MKNKVVLVLISSILFMLMGCGGPKEIVGNYSYKTECLGVEMDGSQTLRAWGNGKNKSDAVEQAKKNAVRDVLFKGIIDGKPECEKRPLVPEVNAQLKYESYFNKFFADGGDFKDFISMKDTPIASKNKIYGTESVTFGVIIRVLRYNLKQKMIDDGILK